MRSEFDDELMLLPLLPLLVVAEEVTANVAKRKRMMNPGRCSGMRPMRKWLFGTKMPSCLSRAVATEQIKAAQEMLNADEHQT